MRARVVGAVLLLVVVTVVSCVREDSVSSVVPDSGAGPWTEGVQIHHAHPSTEGQSSFIVIEDSPRVGTLPRDAIEAVVKSQQAALQRCAGKTPELIGHVVVKFVINTEGAVVQAQVAETSIARADVQACVTNAIRALKFPRPTGGIVIASYPVLFAPKSP